MTKKKIGFLTTFWEMNPNFSLSTVILQQMEMVNKYGYQPVLFVLTNFSDENVAKLPDYVEVRRVIPQWILEPYANTGSKVPDDFEDSIVKTAQVYEKEFADLDCLIAHDICFINTYLIYNIALKVANLNGLRILHQIHSGPSARQLQLGSPWKELWSLPKNTKLIYMNHTEALAAAEMYGLFPKDVRVVYNPMDLRFMYKLSPLTCELIDEYALFEADIICVYPVSSTRMGDDGKAVGKVIRVMGYLKEQGFNVRLIMANAHANGEQEKKVINGFEALAASCGLTPGLEVIFTSHHRAPDYENGVSHDIVVELFQISNIFLFPSYSENAPLILLEAAAAKNLLILNEDFEPMIEFLGPTSSINFGFTSRRHPVRDYPNGEDTYYRDLAKLIASDIGNNKMMQAFMKVRKEFNIDYIAKRQLIPAIEEAISGRNQNGI